MVLAKSNVSEKPANFPNNTMFLFITLIIEFLLHVNAQAPDPIDSCILITLLIKTLPKIAIGVCMSNANFILRLFVCEVPPSFLFVSSVWTMALHRSWIWSLPSLGYRVP